ncbi:hypothetical protein [Staphylococcus hsinchuensis]|uniref:Uncharacterized protein n=1 Tax=Staphylococcus hsinchuensis TaxID=3051183 RepID=A0ABZ3EES8_9STAP
MDSKEETKKRQEFERLDQLKQTMRAETEQMVDEEEIRLDSKHRAVDEMFNMLNRSNHNLKELFEGEASDAAEANIDKLKHQHEQMDQLYDALLKSIRVN